MSKESCYLEALKTIKARIAGEWDYPGLVAIGPLGDTLFDITRIVEIAIKEMNCG